MKIIYILSLIYLLVSFLLIRKVNEKKSIVVSIIYSICLLFCYNIVVVSIYSFMDIKGSFFVLSIFNYIIGTFLNLVSFKKKKIQLYFFKKKELITVLIICIMVFLVGNFRFRGFSVITYETGDPAIHYKQALTFSREFNILNKVNSKDIVYRDFSGVMPIFYVNSGLFMNINSNIPTYKSFMIFDLLCLILSSLLFFVTIFKILGKNKYFYSLILTMLYILAFPLNNMIFGFCYLGLGVMVINLLFFTIINIKDFNKNILFNLIVLFVINFSVFFSYYLFMPCIYLSLGIYYIYLFKKKKISFKNMVVYSIFTLIIPFIMGFICFMLSDFINESTINSFEAVSLEGYIYSNKSSRYFFIIVSIIFLINLIKDKFKFSYFRLIFSSITFYVALFYILYLIDFSGVYYFYKLFYLYWVFAVIYIGKLLIKRKEVLYSLFSLILVGMVIVYLLPNSLFSNFLVNNNIFAWNINTFHENKFIYNKEELLLLNESIKYNDICSENNQFLIAGNSFKNVWFYSYNGNIPLYGYRYDGKPRLGEPNIDFNYWESLNDYSCLVYFYEDNKVDYDKDTYNILYGNNEGIILKKKDI